MQKFIKCYQKRPFSHQQLGSYEIHFECENREKLENRENRFAD